MTIRPKPAAEVSIDTSVVRALLEEQHADLAHLSVIEVDEGWDNKLFRLGEDLAVRIPRRAASAALIEHEQRWLPRLSPRLPLPVPAPLRVGRPGSGFPWSWSVVRWFPGQSALLAPPRDVATTATTAVALGRFLRALHQPAPEDAPHNPWRGVPLAARAKTTAGSTSSSSTGWWPATPCWVCGSAFFRHLRGADHHCGSTAIFTPAICWSAAAVSRP